MLLKRHRKTLAEGEVRILLNRFKPASNFVLLIVLRRYSVVVLFVLCLGV